MILTKKLELTGHSASIYAVGSFQGKIYTASGDKFVARWDIESGMQDNFSIKTDSSIYAIQFLQNSPFLILGTTAGAFHIIDIENKKEIRFIVQHSSPIFCIRENSSKNKVCISDADGNISIWDKTTWELILFIPLLVGKIRDILFSSEGDQMYVACQDGTIRIFDTYFNEIKSLVAHKEGVNSLAFFPLKKNVLISGGKDGFLRVWNLKTEECLLQIPAHNFGIYRILFIKDGMYFVTISRDKSIKLWNAVDCSVIQKIERKNGGHSHAVNDICLLDENHVCTVGDDKRIIHWEVSI